MLGTVLGSGVGAGVGVAAGLVSACATGCVGASVVGGRWVVWFCGALGAGCTELGCPTPGVFTCPVGTGLLCGVVTDGVVGAVATMFCVGVGATGLADTALSRSLPPPPPQAASITLSAVAVQVVRRIWGCLAAMLRLQGATYCTRLTLEKSYSWPRAVPDVSAKMRQSQQGEGGSLSCGSDDGYRRAGVVGTLSCPDCAIRQRQAAKGTPAYAPLRAASALPAHCCLHSVYPKPPAPGALCHALPPAFLPEAAPVAPSAGRRR